jgi:hypothetical protein
MLKKALVAVSSLVAFFGILAIMFYLVFGKAVPNLLTGAVFTSFVCLLRIKRQGEEDSPADRIFTTLDPVATLVAIFGTLFCGVRMSAYLQLHRPLSFWPFIFTVIAILWVSFRKRIKKLMRSEPREAKPSSEQYYRAKQDLLAYLRGLDPDDERSVFKLLGVTSMTPALLIKQVEQGTEFGSEVVEHQLFCREFIGEIWKQTPRGVSRTRYFYNKRKISGG